MEGVARLLVEKGAHVNAQDNYVSVGSGRSGRRGLTGVREGETESRRRKREGERESGTEEEKGRA
eukprot:1016882-Rhodomonas_salina.1